MLDLDDEDYKVLEVLADGRSTPLLIRQQGGFDDRHDSTDASKFDVHQRLDDLTDYGFAVKVTRGLYEITDRGEQALEERDES